ncbi:hypothetical protein F4679DRAFT_591194 [Xylaria curta]|nr:hypothetical protein F4679DRAFT_591194 [Xylaria curta]
MATFGSFLLSSWHIAKYWKDIHALSTGNAAEPATPRKAKAVVKDPSLIEVPYITTPNARVEIGKQVGYNIRFENNTCKDTRLVYMTDGALQAQMVQDNIPSEYKCIIVDEAYERSINTDLIMANLREIVLHKRHGNLKSLSCLLLSTRGVSPTLAALLSSMFFHVKGRTHPVKIQYMRKDSGTLAFNILATVEHIHTNHIQQQSELHAALAQA